MHARFCEAVERLGPKAVPAQILEALGGASCGFFVEEVSQHLQAHRAQLQQQQQMRCTAASMPLVLPAPVAARTFSSVAGCFPQLPPGLMPFGMPMLPPAGMFPVPANYLAAQPRPGLAPVGGFMHPYALPLVSGVTTMPLPQPQPQQQQQQQQQHMAAAPQCCMLPPPYGMLGGCLLATSTASCWLGLDGGALCSALMAVHHALLFILQRNPSGSLL